MLFNLCRLIIILFLILSWAGEASAIGLTLPDETQTTELTTSIEEQADIYVPESVSFNVTDLSQETHSAECSVSATNVVLEEGKKLRVEITSGGVFLPPVPDTATWYSNYVSWNAPTGEHHRP